MAAVELGQDHLDIIANLLEQEIRSLNTDQLFYHVEDLYTIRKIILDAAHD